MATSFRLDPHEYLTLAPGSWLPENELFLVSFAETTWKTLTMVMNHWGVYVVLKPSKQMAINHLKLPFLAARHPLSDSVFLFFFYSEGSPARALDLYNKVYNNGAESEPTRENKRLTEQV